MFVACRRVVLSVLSVLLAAASAAAPAGAQDVVSSSFAQLTGTKGCIVQTEPAGFYSEDDVDLGSVCQNAHGLLQAEGVAVSPDQKDVYVVSAGDSRSGSNAIVSFARDGTTGAITPTGCISDDGGDGRTGSDGLCENGDALNGADDIALSPDGQNVYVAAYASGGISYFARDAQTGKLTQLGCAKAYPQKDHCQQATGLMGTDGVAVSPDGLNVYAVAYRDDAVVSFTRDPATGALTKLGCISRTGSDGICDDGTALEGASSVAVAPDGRQVYVTSALTSAITVFARDDATGKLTQTGCILDQAPTGGPCTDAAGLAGATSIALTSDGKNLYVAAQDGGLLTFDRTAETGALKQSGCLQYVDPTGADQVDPEQDDFALDLPANCQGARAIDSLSEVLVSPDARSVFAASSGELTAFDRDPATGALKQVGCAQEYPTYKSCGQATGLYGASGLGSSDDGKSLYVASRDDATVAVFGAAVAITSRSSRVRRGGVARIRLACPVARPTGCEGRLTFAGHRERTFRLNRGTRSTVRVHLPKALRKRVARRHRLRVTLRASDAHRITRPAARRVTFRR